MTLTQPIRRVSLHEEIVERLREMIVEGGLRPGEKVPVVLNPTRASVTNAVESKSRITVNARR